MRFRFSKASTALLTLCLVSSAAVSCLDREKGYNDDMINYVETGDRVPDFTVEDDAGGSFSSSDFLGRRSLLVFYTVTCGDCRRALPTIQQVYTAIEGESDLYQVILIAREDAPEQVAAYWSQEGYDMHSYYDPNRTAFLSFANMSVPRLYVIDENGVIEWMAIESFSESAADIAALIKGS